MRFSRYPIRAVASTTGAGFSNFMRPSRSENSIVAARAGDCATAGLDHGSV